MFGHFRKGTAGNGHVPLLPQFALVGRWSRSGRAWPGRVCVPYGCIALRWQCVSVELSVSPAADSSGESLLIAIVRDISAQAAMLESLRASEGALSAAMSRIRPTGSGSWMRRVISCNPVRALARFSVTRHMS